MISNLRSIRKQHGLPIAAVAVRARVGTGTIIMIERHGHTPKIETQEKIARALGVDTRAIWPNDNGSDPQPAA